MVVFCKRLLCGVQHSRQEVTLLALSMTRWQAPMRMEHKQISRYWHDTKCPRMAGMGLPRFDGYSAIPVITEDAAAMKAQNSRERSLYRTGIADDKNDMARRPASLLWTGLGEP